MEEKASAAIRTTGLSPRKSSALIMKRGAGNV